MRRGPTRFATPPRPVTHPVTAAAGVNVALLDPGFRYIGEPEALIAAGLALPEWLPSQPGCPNARSFTIQVDDRRVETNYTIAGTYRVTYFGTSEERDAARIRWLSEREAKNRRETATKEATAAAKELAALTRSATAFRTKRLAIISGVLGVLVVSADNFKPDGSGFGFAPACQEQFVDAITELLRVIREGRVIFDPTVRAASVAKIHAKAMAADPDFGEMMATIVEGAKEQHHG